MPVNFEAYRDNAAKDGLPFDPDTHAYSILAFLGEHPETGFKPAEIATETGITPGSVRGTLHRLEDRGLVRHAEPFWAIGDDDRLAATTGTKLGLEALGDRYADDEFEGWEEQAVDPREKRGE